MGASTRVLVIGLDGVGSDLVRRFVDEGQMPNIASLIERGSFGPLRSTNPPVTFPAWSSFLTGTAPSTHGIADFTLREGYSVRFVGAGDRAVPTLLDHLESAGLRCGAAWFPVTYPPARLAGYNISGWDSPVTSEGDPTFVHPARLHRRLEDRFGRDHLAFDSIDEFDTSGDWYLTAGRSIPRRLRRRGEVAAWLMEEEPTDVAAFYFGETDTAAHHFWAFFDETSPRRPSRFEPELADVIPETYRAADEVVGELVARAGGEALVVILSDHGSGGSLDQGIHVNRVLQEAGLLAFKRTPALSAAARLIRGKAVGLVPPALRRPLFRLKGGFAPGALESAIRFGGIDWSRTAAFSEELNYAPSVWINEIGREPRGTVSPERREEIVNRAREALLEVRGPGGDRLVEAVRERRELHAGPLADRFPDLTVELARPGGHTPACLPSGGRPGPAVTRIAGEALLGRKGRSLPGCHTPLGVLLASGPGVTPDAGAGWEGSPPRLQDVAPMICEMAGVSGATFFEGASPIGLRTRPAPRRAGSDSDMRVPSEPAGSYTPEEEAVVAARLKRLGYLEE